MNPPLRWIKENWLEALAVFLACFITIGLAVGIVISARHLCIRETMEYTYGADPIVNSKGEVSYLYSYQWRPVCQEYRK